MAFYKGNGNAKANEEVKYEIVEKCGVLGKRNGDYALELRLVKWNGNEPKYDIRCWKDTDEGEKMLKGITMSGEELEALYGILKGIAEPTKKRKPKKEKGTA